MVTVAGLSCTAVDVQLQSACTNRFVRVQYDGRIFANDNSDSPQSITISSESVSLGNITADQNFRLKLTLYSKQPQMHLCFNKRWRLVGMKKIKGTMCQFYETMVNGYIQYRSVVDETKYIGFTKNGRPIKLIQNSQKFDENCFNFFKWNLTIHSSKTIDTSSNINNSQTTFQKKVQNTRNNKNNNNAKNNTNSNTNLKNTKFTNSNNKKKNSTNCNCNSAAKKNCCLQNKLLPGRRHRQSIQEVMNISKPNLQPDNNKNINNYSSNYRINTDNYDDIPFQDEYLLQYTNHSTNRIVSNRKVKVKDDSSLLLKKSKVSQDLTMQQPHSSIVKLRHSYGNHRKRSTTLDSF